MLLLLVAVAAAAWPDASAPADRIAGALASDSLAADTAWRATVAALGPVELAPGKPTATRGETPPFDTIVVSDEGAIVRVADEQRGVRVVVGVRRADLALRPDDQAAVRAAPGAVPKDGSVSVAGGTPLTLGAKTKGDVRVGFSDQGLTLDGWMPASVLVTVWRETRWPMDGRFADLDIVDPGDTGVAVPLRDAPNGAVLATLRKDTTLLLFAAGPADGGWRPVEVRTTAVHARGWVAADAVVDVPGHGVGFGGGGGSPPERGTLVQLQKGALIHAADTSTAFGRALRDVQVPGTQVDDRHVRVSVTTAWGSLPGVVECIRITTPVGTMPRCEVE
jgi:hypothetical protein